MLRRTSDLTAAPLLADMPASADPVVASRDSLAVAVIDQARSLIVSSDIDYAAAGNFLTTVLNPLLREVDDAFDANIRRWHEGHKKAIADKRKAAEPILAAKKVVDQLMTAWQLEKRRRAQEQERLDLQAARDDAERRAAEEAARLLSEGGDRAEHEAAEILSQLSSGEVQSGALAAAPPVVHHKAQSAGTSFRIVHRFRVIDPDKVKRPYLTPNETAIRKAVDLHGMGAEEVVGRGSIEVWEDGQIGSRAR